MVTTAATDPAVTVIVNGGDVNPPELAVTTADPGATPIARPVAFTFTTVAAEVAYVNFAFVIASPFTSRALAVSCTGSPTAIVCFGASIVTDPILGASRAPSPAHADKPTNAVRIAVDLMKSSRNGFACSC
jgi:hypothetical protein